jgi:hypothetical protein
MKDNMLGWANENDKVELNNKVIDFGKQTLAPEAPPKALVGLTEFA